jgi:hypothetical protein
LQESVLEAWEIGLASEPRYSFKLRSDHSADRAKKGKIQRAPVLQSYPLDLVLGKTFLSAVVEFGHPRALMRRHFLRVLEGTAV